MSDNGYQATKSMRCAERYAVNIIGIRNSVTDPLNPIDWIDKCKVLSVSENKMTRVIQFLFAIPDKPNGFTTLTAVEMTVSREASDWKPVLNTWKPVSAELRSEWQPHKENNEKYVFPNGRPEKVI